jgi:hypothetical protein
MAGAGGCECSNYFYETSRPGGGGAPSKGNVEKLGDFTAAATETLRQMPEELRHRLGAGSGSRVDLGPMEVARAGGPSAVGAGGWGSPSGEVPSLDKVQNLGKTNIGESRSISISS